MIFLEYHLVSIREGLLCGKGVEPLRGRGRLIRVRETQLFLRSNLSNRVEFTDIFIYVDFVCVVHICSAGYVELPVLSTSMLGILHAVEALFFFINLVLGLLVVYKIPYGSCIIITAVEVLVLGLLVVYKIPLCSCIFNTAVVVACVILMVSPDVVDIESEYFVELPVLLYLLQCLVYHMLSKTRF